jgi:hypothetical protein
MANLGQSHCITVKHIFCYLKGIMDFGLCFKRCIKDVILAKVHFDKDLNHSWG